MELHLTILNEMPEITALHLFFESELGTQIPAKTFVKVLTETAKRFEQGIDEYAETDADFQRRSQEEHLKYLATLSLKDVYLAMQREAMVAQLIHDSQSPQ